VKILEVTDLQMPGLEPYRTLRRPVEHQKKGIFVAEGEKVVRRLLESKIPVHSLLITPEWFSVYQRLIETRNEEITVFLAPKRLVESIVGFHLHQGIMAVASIPSPVRLEEVMRFADTPYLFVAIDGLTNAENLGVLVRNCVAFGVHALLVGETSSNPFLRRAVRNSMGAVFKLPVVQVEQLADTLDALRRERVLTIAAHPHMEQTRLWDVDVRRSCCLVFGSEGAGISERVLSHCEVHAAIPMQNGVDSLNVASASAVFLAEVMRRRKGASS